MLSSTVSLESFVIAMGVSIVIGLFISVMYMYKSRYTKSFVITLSLLPAIVSSIIYVINGNIGAGVALTGVFSLIRFRSVPGSAQEIGAIFLAMGSGLIIGMGFVWYACIFTVVLLLVNFIYIHIGIGEAKQTRKMIKITVPEDLDFSNWINDIFEKYTASNSLLSVKSTHMGSLFKLQYEVDLKKEVNEKEFIDEIRCRNGNLEISMLNNSVTSEL